MPCKPQHWRKSLIYWLEYLPRSYQSRIYYSMIIYNLWLNEYLLSGMKLSESAYVYNIIPFVLSNNTIIMLNSSPPGQDVRHFTDGIFVNKKYCILMKISLKFVPKGAIENNPALLYRMAWRWKGDKPLSKALLTRFTDAYMRHYGGMS